MQPTFVATISVAMTYTLGFSPCPNDTFIFDALVNGHIDTRGLKMNYVLEDVETLNRYALAGKLDITKLSYSTLLHTIHQYALLHSGSALGKGVGPLLVTKHGFDLETLPEKTIAIPGANTTANLLLTLAHPNATKKTEVLFSNIEQAVLDGEFDAGLIIHESRFTYAAKGLVQLMDLGDWWERTTLAPIPLGGIVARRSLPREVIATIDALIKESLAWSWKHYPELSPFVVQHAQELEPAVMRQHIDLYVNDYTSDLGENGRHAIDTLFSIASAAGLIDGSLPETIYY